MTVASNATAHTKRLRSKGRVIWTGSVDVADLAFPIIQPFVGKDLN
jgi:hypothetical protein